jgi:hypothetical protein
MQPNKQMKCGHMVFDTYDQEDLELIGFVGNHNDLDPESRVAEETEVRSGAILYYYCEESTLQHIRNGAVAPTATEQGLCENCLRASRNTPAPHYGDGVYFSQHSNLRDLNQTHPAVVQSHGIDMVKRRWRADYLCIDDVPFKKIYQTGGVIRSKQHFLNSAGRLELDFGVVAPLIQVDYEAYEE